MKKRNSAYVVLAGLACFLMAGVGSSVARADSRLAPTSMATTATSADSRVSAPAAAQGRRQGLADRESQAQDLERFNGGGAGIYIGGSTLAIVLLIVLIIIVL